MGINASHTTHPDKERVRFRVTCVAIRLGLWHMALGLWSHRCIARRCFYRAGWGVRPGMLYWKQRLSKQSKLLRHACSRPGCCSYVGAVFQQPVVDRNAIHTSGDVRLGDYSA